MCVLSEEKRKKKSLCQLLIFLFMFAESKLSGGCLLLQYSGIWCLKSAHHNVTEKSSPFYLLIWAGERFPSHAEIVLVTLKSKRKKPVFSYLDSSR